MKNKRDSVYAKCFEIYGIEGGLDLCSDIAKHRLDAFIEEQQKVYWIVDMRERTGFNLHTFYKSYPFTYEEAFEKPKNNPDPIDFHGTVRRSLEMQDRDFKTRTLPFSKNFTSTDHLVATRDIRNKYEDLLKNSKSERHWPKSISDIFPRNQHKHQND